MIDSRHYSRREMLRLSAGGLLSLGLWPGVLRAAGNGQGGNFHFIVVNDLHYFDTHCGVWLETAVQQMKTHPEKPAFCVINGDLSEEGTAVQISSVKDLFKNLGIPVFTTIGNHDHIIGFRTDTYEMVFPNRLNYIFEFKGWQFVAFDSTQGQEAFKAAVQPSTLQWIDDNIRQLSKTSPTVILTHFPFGPGTQYRSLNADLVLTRFRNHNLQAVLNGHWHGFTEKHLDKITLTTNRCCSWHRRNFDGTSEKGYFLCEAKDGQISRTFVQVPCDEKSNPTLV